MLRAVLELIILTLSSVTGQGNNQSPCYPCVCSRSVLPAPDRRLPFMLANVIIPAGACSRTAGLRCGCLCTYTAKMVCSIDSNHGPQFWKRKRGVGGIAPNAWRNSLVAKRGSREPPGQINGTNFLRLRILCRKRILMLPENIFGRRGFFGGIFEVTSV